MEDLLVATLQLTGYSAGIYRLTSHQREEIRQFVDQNRVGEPTFTVSGFASTSSNHELNLALSTARAEAVANFIVDLKIPNDKVITRSFGERLFTGNDRKGQLSMAVLIEAL
ncbi:MAG: hypothetical protein EOS74_10735 [Mesorhizobium sp.]|nr:MAG: hypothetical protein EOS74_10735 [Mesorhizobium sp.]